MRLLRAVVFGAGVQARPRDRRDPGLRRAAIVAARAARRVRVVAPHLLLILAVLLWSSNFVVGRLVRHEITPIALTFWRWALALVLLLPLSAGELRRHWRLIIAEWKLVVALGASGIGAYSICIYEALRATTAINAALMLAMLPPLIALAGRLLYGDAVTRRQALGIGASLLGAVVIIIGGDPAALLALRFNSGDLWMLAAVPLWAVYAVLQTRRPAALSPLVLVTASVVAGVLLLLPAYVWDLSRGGRVHLTIPNALGIGYTALGVSAIGYVLWNRGAAVLGAGRAGVYINLIPVGSAALAILLLGETLAPYHLAGATLVAGGIALASRARLASALRAR